VLSIDQGAGSRGDRGDPRQRRFYRCSSGRQRGLINADESLNGVRATLLRHEVEVGHSIKDATETIFRNQTQGQGDAAAGCGRQSTVILPGNVSVAKGKQRRSRRPRKNADPPADSRRGRRRLYNRPGAPARSGSRRIPLQSRLPFAASVAVSPDRRSWSPLRSYRPEPRQPSTHPTAGAVEGTTHPTCVPRIVVVVAIPDTPHR